MQIQKEAVKAVILKAAVTEFAQYGYQKASIRRIAQAAGITPGNIYVYFPNKKQLFDEVIGPVIQETTQLIEGIQVKQVQVEPYLSEVIHVFCEIFFRKKQEFLILIRQSSESGQNLLFLFRDTVLDCIRRQYPPQTEGDRILLETVTTSLIEGIRYIFENSSGSLQEMSGTLHAFLSVLFAGLAVQMRKEGAEWHL